MTGLFSSYCLGFAQTNYFFAASGAEAEAELIDAMWFALGTNAQNRSDEHFKKFKMWAAGRLLNLKGSTADNNAFVMQIGQYLAVEFLMKIDRCLASVRAGQMIRAMLYRDEAQNRMIDILQEADAADGDHHKAFFGPRWRREMESRRGL